MKQCLLCLDFSKENICNACKADLPWVKSTCQGCGRHSESAGLCKICIKTPALWDFGLAPLLYETPISGLISELKFAHPFVQARTLTNLFMEALPAKTHPELILPIPLHPWRMLWRGYNQSTELARLLSKGLGIPYSPDYLKRVKHARTQRGSDKKTREQNMAESFILKKDLPVSHVAIVDDVMTTGETLKSVCRAIRSRQNNLKIEVWTLAQVCLTKVKS